MFVGNSHNKAISDIDDVLGRLTSHHTVFNCGFIRVVDSEYVNERANYFVKELQQYISSQAVVLDAGLLLSWSALLQLHEASYFNGFDEIWLFSEHEDAYLFSSFCVDFSVKPYALFSSKQDDAANECLHVLEDIWKDRGLFLGLLDGDGVLFVTNDSSISEDLMMDTA
jgi:hypothetical protein